MLSHDKQNFHRLRDVPMTEIANVRTASDSSTSILAVKGEGILGFHPSQKIHRLMEEEETFFFSPQWATCDAPVFL